MATLIIRSIPGKKRLINKLIRLTPPQISIDEKKLKQLYFYRQFVGKNDLCFDVGANIGNRVEIFLDIGARVVAIEPQNECCKLLNSKFGNKIKVVNKGLCEKECIREFHICDSNDMLSSFSVEWINLVSKKRCKKNQWDKTIEVEMTTLDSLIEEYGLPTFIKIDVEGYELEVLNGLSHPINMISFEYTVPEQTNRIEQCIKTVERTNPNIRCNFSIGESMEWALIKWLSVSEFLEFIKNKDFIKTSQGDIYLKQI